MRSTQRCRAIRCAPQRQQGGNVNEVIAEFEKNASTPEKLVEYAERPVKPSVADASTKLSKQPSNGLDYRKMLVDLLDEIEKLGSRMPVESHMTCKQYRSTISLPANLGAKSNGNTKQEPRAETKIPATPVATLLRGVAENANLLAKAISTAVTLWPGPQPTSEPEERQSEQNADQTDSDLTVPANEEAEPQKSEPESPTPAAKRRQVGTDATRFLLRVRQGEKPYAVRDMNNPHLGIMCKFKGKTEVERYINDREREAVSD